MDGYAGINERGLSREYKIKNQSAAYFGVSGVRYMAPGREDASCEMASRQCMRIHSSPSTKPQA